MTDLSRNPFRVSLTVILVALFGLALDQATKYLMVNVVMQPPRLIPVTPFFNLTLGFNEGASFGMLGGVMQGRPWAMIALTGAITAVIAFWALRAPNLRARAGFALIVGGSLGNITDRIRQGAVTDFLDFYWQDWHWPTFNLADVVIFIGAMLVLAASIPERHKTETPLA